MVGERGLVDPKVIENYRKKIIYNLRSYLQKSRESCRTHLNSLDYIEDFIDKNKTLNQPKLDCYSIHLN